MGSLGKGILTVGGGIIGAVYGGGNFAAGAAAGSALGEMIDPTKIPEAQGPNLSGVSGEAKKYQQLNNTQADQLSAQQTALQNPAIAQQLADRAMGKGPSLAQAQLQSATNRNLSQQLAAAAAMRGRNPAATQRQLLQQQGEAGRNLAGDSATARLLEQQQAQQAALQQGNVVGQQQAQNIQQGYTIGVGGQLEQARLQAQTDAINAGIAQQNNKNRNNLVGSVIGAGASLFGGSKGGGGSTDGSGWTHQAGDVDQVFGASEGGFVPGKAEKTGDSPKNDFVHALLSPREIVIKRSAAKSPEAAKAFIDQLFEQQKGKEAQKEKKHKNTKLAAALSSKKKA